MELRYLCMAILAGNLALPAYASAADTVRDDVGRGTAPYSDRDQMKSWTDERGRLQKSLRVGEGKDYYRQELDKLGYRITAVNKNDPDYLEYEVVKGSNSYEVQIDLDKATGKAKKLDVTTNMWKADSTEQALQDENYKLDYSDATAATSPRYSDRDRMKTWTNEKERLEQTLKAHQAKSYYPQALKDLGYQITAVNDNEQDYVEYEIVKGQDSYEVQIDLDEDTGRAKKVDVTANLWKADATDKALDRRQD
jgi:N-acetyl-gamma-glutamylphosphate reductase